MLMRKSDIPSTPGIYAIVNLVNQHFYVGSAKNLSDRRRQHLRMLEAGKHGNPHLQYAYNMYGPDAFRFDILEHVEHVENLLAREQHYIDSLDPQYNIARIAGSTLGRKATDEQRAKQGAARRGRIISPEWRAKISAAK